MPEQRTVAVDGNEAAASVAHRLSEVVAIYPITPASPMGELADAWSAHGRKNIWGAVPRVVEMQSEAGAAGAVHGALQTGALTTTFTASQGLLLMLPNMYKIAGELTAFTVHVSSRTLATHALSIFGDHSDVMACRQTGFALLASGSVQEAHDLACVAHAATLQTRIPFLHFFDGFRTSHEMATIRMLSDEDLRAMIDDEGLEGHRARALTPDRPVIRGTAQNPDVFFQAREAVNPHYDACPGVVQSLMVRFARLTGRSYRLFDYAGHPEAERVVVLMGSGCGAARETVDVLAGRGEPVGLVSVRLFRPFSVEAFTETLPPSTRKIAVLDRTKEPGSAGEPLYQDVVTALREAAFARRPSATDAIEVSGGRYGLSSKEVTPAMIKGVLDALKAPAPPRHFTVGIQDDVTHLSLEYDPDFHTEREEVVRGVFFGLGADGTVSASKNSVKIIGEGTDQDAQGYFVYDSKKAGGVTVSHLRFGPGPIRSTYRIGEASFVACHHYPFLDRYDVLEHAAPGAVFLLNAPYPPDEVWDRLSREVQEAILQKGLRFHVIDAREVSRRVKLGVRINTIMQTCFFALSGVLPQGEAVERIKASIRETYAKKGEELVRRNFAAVDEALANLHRVEVPGAVTAERTRPPPVPGEAPEDVRRLHGEMMAGRGDRLPVSAMPVDGTWPLGTTPWETRNIAYEIPRWEPDLCIQCGKCAFVCPHATIRIARYAPEALEGAPRASAPPRPAAARTQASASRFRWRPRTAPGAGSAS